MEVDLHCHSIYSDGTKTPEDLLNKAKSIGLKVLALTDHDEIEGAKELISLEHDGIILYSGVELSAKVDKGQMHILGYNIDVNNIELGNRLKAIKLMSINNVKLYIKKLEMEYNIKLPEDEITNLLNRKGRVGRPLLALLLIKYGYCNSVAEAFDKYLNDEKITKIQEKIQKEECIQLINNAGGVAVLAHPWSLEMTDDELYQEVAYLKKVGLRGIEVYHSANSKEQIAFYHKIAEDFNLLETGGTDYHGKEVKPLIKLGSGINNNVNININD